MSGETETSHEPTPDELARTQDAEAERPGHVAGEAPGADDHGDVQAHDDHAHGEEAIGPIDRAAWGAFALGVAAGLVVALCLVITTTLLASPAPI